MTYLVGIVLVLAGLDVLLGAVLDLWESLA